jgi:hypothetical protein
MKVALSRHIASVRVIDNQDSITAWVILAISAHNRRVQMAEVRWLQDASMAATSMVWMPIVSVRVVKHLANTIA